ncbi:MAG TPA: hypothetical protein VJU87_04585 [Gemmatimonadaceae bacterium]|nr:hypothetical protein [Gemmatimonadaceae bacterium]
MRSISTPLALLALASLLAACTNRRQARTDTGSAAGSVAGASAAAPATAATPAPTAGNATVKVASNATNGTYLTDENGRALYMFEKDSRGQSACDSACARDWPPFAAQGTPAAGDSVKTSMLSTITRKDGSRQVTYNGMPLYHYAKDTGPGDTKGENVKEFGAEWYLVSPAGKKQEGRKESGHRS